ncbi:MAG: prolipoprotein diacylglyceryl transferase [Candidatus Dactylopiibacterium carminicum]|uniref:Phosphatidylglycerol--prolipoprotein diacylglyceryl transferase n=1 Tax=Candidatus Dactylopiibacterium carminicum TaxID=857335 RepID=A0A272ENV4_9RHOO|nr:prolipoprotein diacylglyceryl transferase [Candidatus Dactylopiibacterium carminicum]KAF7599537.1 prolipoprotein diacylglyceryl transferase [Candidatus Dactylopiibacterium carminicum]PAS91778.1 MAG: prolipoprotein diacylglyceryl transferase [Candidatus Dactylopiibacterium carminicum]PAS92666.1 MAG: prolipoprotein diacylglyceryl transferase [Candidatus Dactylopiibacterium carminicum]PAS99542.1 MAG: prolipoprotein diacylglyceryl transferase [Candidatus Dactylopiibacterium carminicum]
MPASPLLHPQFDPVFFSLGPLHVRWYGLMYVLAFALFVLLGRWRIRNRPDLGWSRNELDDLLFYGMLGVILGGRLGYVLFYKAGFYLTHPLDILKVWEGGMAFHGGLLGVLFALWFFARKTRRHFLQVGDFVAPLVPTGLAAGRMGNFINGELWGRVTSPDAPWAMLFPQAWHADAALVKAQPALGASLVQYVDPVSQQVLTGLPRHASQLYQFALEGLTLFTILWLFSRKPRPMGAVSGLFLIGYGSFRFIAEFAREPDDFLGLLAGQLSMGQWLSLPMVLAGVAMMIWAYRRKA